jgi:hypothetical protein
MGNGVGVRVAVGTAKAGGVGVRVGGNLMPAAGIMRTWGRVEAATTVGSSVGVGVIVGARMRATLSEPTAKVVGVARAVGRIGAGFCAVMVMLMVGSGKSATVGVITVRNPLALLFGCVIEGAAASSALLSIVGVSGVVCSKGAGAL